MAATPKRGLGKGLGALIPTESATNTPRPEAAQPTAMPSGGSAAATVAATYAELPLDAITPNPRQPRTVFDDEARTWFHISPVTGDIVGRIDGSRRSYRWLFNALHTFDFQLLLTYRPAWDIVVLVLSVLGIIVSASGVVVGWRYLRR